ncbi:hypothetical protein [Azospirillum baldaniorum]|uniref:hypothetical protein n=1 Tax=Azospirillum baldaniorum TaxID=1064539 RepID=UPI0030B85983
MATRYRSPQPDQRVGALRTLGGQGGEGGDGVVGALQPGEALGGAQPGGPAQHRVLLQRLELDQRVGVVVAVLHDVADHQPRQGQVGAQMKGDPSEQQGGFLRPLVMDGAAQIEQGLRQPLLGVGHHRGGGLALVQRLQRRLDHQAVGIAGAEGLVELARLVLAAGALVEAADDLDDAQRRLLVEHAGEALRGGVLAPAQLQQQTGVQVVQGGEAAGGGERLQRLQRRVGLALRGGQPSVDQRADVFRHAFLGHARGHGLGFLQLAAGQIVGGQQGDGHLRVVVLLQQPLGEVDGGVELPFAQLQQVGAAQQRQVAGVGGQGVRHEQGGGGPIVLALGEAPGQIAAGRRGQRRALRRRRGRGDGVAGRQEARRGKEQGTERRPTQPGPPKSECHHAASTCTPYGVRIRKA